MRFDELNDDNYMMFAIKHYENPQAVTQEDFYEDLKKFKYIKRLLKRYQKSGELKSHLTSYYLLCYAVTVTDPAAGPTAPDITRAASLAVPDASLIVPLFNAIL